jgi:hypothetical protein
MARAQTVRGYLLSHAPVQDVQDGAFWFQFWFLVAPSSRRQLFCMAAACFPGSAYPARQWFFAWYQVHAPRARFTVRLPFCKFWIHFSLSVPRETFTRNIIFCK